MTPSDILLLISLAVIVLWTIRLARDKGLNSWLWGLGVVILITLAWTFSRQFLGLVVMAPLVFLLLFRSPLFRKRATPASVPCPRCAAPDSGALNFCVQCGWDLSQPYASAPKENESSPATPEPPPERQPAAPIFETAPDSATVSGAQTPPKPTAGPEGAAEPVFAQEAAPSSTATPETPQAEPQHPPLPARRIPTAANMTERGIALFSQERFEEAIDQFTKAIALDPKYRLAWERRAEAYGRLGRAEREAADKRHLEAF